MSSGRSTPSTPRREFLSQLAAGAAAVAATACAPAAMAATQAPAPASPPPAPAVPAAQGAPQGAKRAWDVSWVDRLTGKHKAVFDSPEIEDGLALWHAFNYMKGYHDIYATTDADVQAVIVIRHGAIPMAFGDALWEKYGLGKHLKINDPTTGKPALRNPFYTEGPDRKPSVPSASLQSLAARGAIFLGCNLAAMGFASRLAAREKLDARAVQEEVRNGLVPGVILQPSGIFAVHRAQEAGCTFLKST